LLEAGPLRKRRIQMIIGGEGYEGYDLPQMTGGEEGYEGGPV
jgi:hypothetical protein